MVITKEQRVQGREGLVEWPVEFAERYRRAGYWSGRPLIVTGHGRPAALALVDGSVRITHAELADLTDGLAVRLAGQGMRRGDTIVVQLPNCWEFVILTSARLRLGVRSVMALPAHRSHELRHLADLTDACAIAVPDSFRGFDHQALALDLAEELPGLQRVLVAGDRIRPGALDLREMITPPTDPSEAGRLLDEDPPTGSDVAVFLLSGGTTGVPKVIPRTHDDYAYNARRTAELSGTDARSVHLVALPAAHNFALACPGILGTLSAGGTVVMARSPDPDACFASIGEHRVTHTAVVPAVAHRWIDRAAAAGERHDLSSLRVLQVGGSRMPPESARRVRPVLGTTLQQAFGMAEGLCCFTALDDPDEVICETQGRPMCEDDEVCIVDEADAPVPAGRSGMLLTRGPYTLRGYYRSSEHNARAFTHDGWYRTGDVVHRDGAGNIVVDGRTKDVIVRGGEKISAEELENLLLTVPAVGAVAAVAAPDPELGERVAIFVIVRTGQPVPTLDGLRAALELRGCAIYMLPERLELVDELPETAIGKIDKKRLRERLVDRPAPTGSAV